MRFVMAKSAVACSAMQHGSSYFLGRGASANGGGAAQFLEDSLLAIVIQESQKRELPQS
jgi:hypothetical protein